MRDVEDMRWCNATPKGASPSHSILVFLAIAPIIEDGDRAPSPKNNPIRYGEEMRSCSRFLLVYLAIASTVEDTDDIYMIANHLPTVGVHGRWKEALQISKIR